MNPRLVEGWAIPYGSKDAHFIQANATSLCGKWRWLGAPNAIPLADARECGVCRRKLDAQIIAASR